MANFHYGLINKLLVTAAAKVVAVLACRESSWDAGDRLIVLRFLFWWDLIIGACMHASS